MATTSSSEINANGKMPLNQKEMSSMIETVTEFGKDLVSSSEEKIKMGVDYAKKYPVHTAVGFGLLGFAIGFLAKGSK